MNTQEILALFDREQRIEIEYPGMRKDLLPGCIRFVRPAPGMSFILYSWLDETNADAVIQEQIDYFTQIDQPFSWKVYNYDTPPDLKQRLLAHVFQPDDEDMVMVLDLRQVPPVLLEPPAADVRRITHRDQLADVIRVEQQVWGGTFDWITDRLGGHMDIPDYVSVFVAYADGQPACTGWTYFVPQGQFASLWGGSTVAEFRQRGLYSAILAARVQEATQRGYRYLTIDASPMSRPIVAKHGFQLLAYAQDFNWIPKLTQGDPS
jgi:hypothetical protein